MHIFLQPGKMQRMEALKLSCVALVMFWGKYTKIASIIDKNKTNTIISLK